jgi:hypothetical protein
MVFCITHFLQTKIPFYKSIYYILFLKMHDYGTCAILATFDNI